MKKLMFNFLIWTVELGIKKLNDKERILYLLNRLLDEMESQGFSWKHEPCKAISIWGHKPDVLKIESNTADTPFCIYGKRKF